MAIRGGRVSAHTHTHTRSDVSWPPLYLVVELDVCFDAHGETNKRATRKQSGKVGRETAMADDGPLMIRMVG